MPTIIIDPGHGGSDDVGRSTWRGEVGAGGELEKDFTLALARRVQARLRGRARLTRDRDENLDLADRARVARTAGARVFLSLHGHPDDGASPGLDLWVHDDASAPSAALARTLSDAARRLGGAAGRVRRGPLAVLAPRALAGSTAACLVEVGGLSRVAAGRADRSRVERLAALIAEAVERFLATGGAGTYGAAAARGGPPGARVDRRAPGI